MVRIRSTTESIATRLTIHDPSDSLSTQRTRGPALLIESDLNEARSPCVTVRNLTPDLIAALDRSSEARLQSVLRVSVTGSGAQGGDDLPPVLGRHQVLEDGVRFVPHFPFEPGVPFRATFDPAPLGRPEPSEALTLEFSLPQVTSAERAHVQQLFPSGDCLPENLLRFYACFSHPMQRGWAEGNITVLGPDGRPAADVLYRPPVELWDRSMRCLTILLDPGRLKRGVGPNRALGPPLKAGEEYALVIGAGMVDSSGRRLSGGLRKPFQVTKPLREPIALERWRVRGPAAMSRDPLELVFPAPLDWAQLWHAISIASEEEHPIAGRIAIDQGERRWSFTPRSLWKPGSYQVRVAPDLEDVCGNNLLGAFDRPLRSPRESGGAVASLTICFSPVPSHFSG
jgi:hypothetical protein